VVVCEEHDLLRLGIRGHKKQSEECSQEVHLSEDWALSL
jgi:hypothetical protein